MTALQDLLELQEESRLTGVAVLPLAHEVSEGTGQLVLQVAVGLTESSDVAVQAVSRFLGRCVLVINGKQADGSDWFATFQYVEAPGDDDLLYGTSYGMLDRAFLLTGVEAEDVWGHVLGWSDLHAIYESYAVTGVVDWSTLDLALGLVVTLTHGDLATLVPLVDGPADELIDGQPDGAAPPDPELDLGARAAGRRRRFDALLRQWAATYDGPDAPQW